MASHLDQERMTIVSFRDSPTGPSIVRLLAGTGTTADEAEVRTWLADDPDRARQLEEVRAIWREAGMLQRDWDTTALQERILRAIHTGPAFVAAVPFRGGQRRRFTLWLASVTPRPRVWVPVMAAAALLLVFGTLSWRRQAMPHTRAAVGLRPFTEVVTQRGQRVTLQLSDGTRVTLGVDSRLRYPEPFAGSAGRDVYLEGEGYFEVAHDAERPFRVHAGEVVTRVLGTRFDVRAYAEDRAVRVVVAEGRVGLGRGTVPETVLRGGDVATLGAAGMPMVQHRVDVASYLAWMDGRLTFADTPVRDVVVQMARWYNLDVRLGDPSLADLPYTISLRGDEPPDQVLHTLAAAIGGQVVRRGAAYVILRQSATGDR